MKKNNKVNRFDVLVESLVEAFLKVPNFDLIQHDEEAKKAFNMVSFRIAEISSYKELICSHFIPATNKAIFENRQLFKHSKYKNFLNVKGLDFNETLYDTVRLAYVGLFHKIESFVNDIVKMVDMLYKIETSTKQTIAQWAKSKYSFDIRDWQQNTIIFKINWICNCVKHKDGYPLKDPKPFKYRSLPEDERILLTPEEFKKDCEQLIKFYPSLIQVMMAFGLFRFAIDSNEKSDFPDIVLIEKDSIAKMEEKIIQMVKSLEQLKLDPVLGY